MEISNKILTRMHTKTRKIKGLSLSSAQQSNLDVDNYKIPLPGKYLAELQFKIWGKYPCLHCFFKTQEGDKIRLASFKNEDTGKYSPRDLKINFSEPGIEFNVYLLHVEINSKGRPAWISAKKKQHTK